MVFIFVAVHIVDIVVVVVVAVVVVVIVIVVYPRQDCSTLFQAAENLTCLPLCHLIRSEVHIVVFERYLPLHKPNEPLCV